MRIVTKQDDLNRIRTYGPTPEDMADARPRVRRAALCHLAAHGSAAECMRALDAAVSDKADVVFLSVARTVTRKRGELQGIPSPEVVQSAIELRAEKLGVSYEHTAFLLAAGE